MHSAIKTQRMRNYAEQRITEYKRNLEAVLAKDPKVQEYKQKQKQQQQEVTQEVINNMSRDAVKNRRKKRTVAILPSLDNQEIQIEDREMPNHPLLNQQSQQKSYKLAKPVNGQLKAAMRLSFFDKAFQRDCM
uniref:Uncharacterized protein n=1 Tax=viral metagenome TaxID=1070528 RepID=A0A6C0HE81_9ZZZZ